MANEVIPQNYLDTQFSVHVKIMPDFTAGSLFSISSTRLQMIPVVGKSLIHFKLVEELGFWLSQGFCACSRYLPCPVCFRGSGSWSNPTADIFLLHCLVYLKVCILTESALTEDHFFSAFIRGKYHLIIALSLLIYMVVFDLYYKKIWNLDWETLVFFHQ